MNVANSPDSKSQPPIEKYNVGILLFDGVEVLDFAGPFEVFSRTRLVLNVESRRSDATAPFRVFTVARKSEPVTATGDLQLMSAGDYAGIDMALHVVDQIWGASVAAETAN